jgi:hypothetical protein
LLAAAAGVLNAAAPNPIVASTAAGDLQNRREAGLEVPDLNSALLRITAFLEEFKMAAAPASKAITDFPAWGLVADSAVEAAFVAAAEHAVVEDDIK